METPQLDTHSKALSLNLDPTIFGTFAEIGAGQEVARWFLRVGAASGTVAKTISAYDKEVSDDLYGAGTRYVSRERLEAMLDREWQLLLSQLGATRGPTTRFFAFADTVSARNYAGTNECHGWLGIRFQERPEGESSDVLLHVNLLDPAALLQQESVGILGVNLVHGVFHTRATRHSFLSALAADLSTGRVEIDLVVLRGSAFRDSDREGLLLELVREGLAQAVIFPSGGELLPPTEILYKRPVVLVPGTFADVEPVHGKILSAALAELEAEAGEASRPPVALYSITLAPLLEGEAPADPAEILRRVEALLAYGRGVLVSRDRELYRTTDFVNRFTSAPLRFAVGPPLLVRVFEQMHYSGLEGRLLEGIARLFADNVRVYAYPTPTSILEDRLPAVAANGWTIRDVDGWVTADRFRPAPPLGHLYDYLLATGFIVPARRA